MCGIAGIVTTEPGRFEMPPALGAMRDALRHRGPDDSGLWQSPSGAAGFAHTRLAVLDLTPAGRQPMSTPDGRFTIAFNGEIYNFRELRDELEEQGIRFQTRTDTEVVLWAYCVRGESCVAQLRGMFAFALWDERERTCLFARDRFGLKPLYYRAGDGPLVFASEVRAIVASGLVARELDPQGVYGYFRSGSVPEPHTLLRDVRCVEAGHTVCWRDGRVAARRYWDLCFGPSAAATVPDPVAATRAALLDSVAHHFVSDVPVGVFLSGGIDSTALVALARSLGRSDLHTVSMTLPGSPDDEGEAARRTAAHFGTLHEEWPMDAVRGREMFGRFLEAADQPSIDGLNTFVISGFARERGLKVALSGLGADELFGGYRSFRDVPRIARWDRWLSAAGPVRSRLGRTVERLAPGPRSRRVGDMLGRPAQLQATWSMFRGIFTHAESLTLAERYAAGAAGEPLEGAVCDTPVSDPTAADAVSRLELTRYMRNQLLRDSDVMSMAWGLELRAPFLDAGLVDTLSRIPAAIRLRAGKRLLLDAVPEVPHWVACPPKRCFQFPLQQWLGAEWQDVFADVDRSAPVPTETWYRKWCICAFDRWLEKLRLVPAPAAAPAMSGGSAHGH